MVAVLAVALDNSDLDNIPVKINGRLIAAGGQAETAMFGDDLAGHNPDDGCFIFADRHAKM
ncbi:hypothetical protein D3C80_2211680 [compost metagenome]